MGTPPHLLLQVEHIHNLKCGGKSTQCDRRTCSKAGQASCSYGIAAGQGVAGLSVQGEPRELLCLPIISLSLFGALVISPVCQLHGSQIPQVTARAFLQGKRRHEREREREEKTVL